MGYNTKHRQQILSCLQKFHGEHVTVQNLRETLLAEGVDISLSTLYRHLESFVAAECVRKYLPNGRGGACFQYVGEHHQCREHYHLLCENCGKLIHLDCQLLDRIAGHIQTEHDFHVDTMKTVFYGLCADCRRLEAKESQR